MLHSRRASGWIGGAAVGGMLMAAGAIAGPGPASDGATGAAAAAPATATGAAHAAEPAAVAARPSGPAQQAERPAPVEARGPTMESGRGTSGGVRDAARINPAVANARAEGTAQVGAGQAQRVYDPARGYNHQGNYRRRLRPSPGYIYQYYGGYYPVYIDVPIGSQYYDSGPVVNGSSDGGAPATTDDGSGGAVIAPNTITVSPQTNDAVAAATPAPDAAGAIGPDSLVEAVQAELIRRGYLQGKADAIFSADTATALRRFQQDNYLATTGHLNEPTLHALNLD